MIHESSKRQIQEHLDRAAFENGYLDAINGTSPESLVDGQMKMLPLKRALGSSAIGGSILSVGVGQGEELHALRSIMGNEVAIHGVDLSLAALQRTFERDQTHNLNLQILLGDARQLPFEDNSLSAVVESAVLHEVYSYNEPDGLVAYEQAITEAARVLNPGGYLYIREFACPKPEGPLKLESLTQEAADFYDYFLDAFVIGLHDTNNHSVRVDSNGRLARTGDITQILMHFRNFWNDETKNMTYIGDRDWKELKESYLLPSKTVAGQYMDPDDFCSNVVDIASNAGYPLELETLSLQKRNRVNIFLEQHFKILDSSNQDVTSRILEQATAKIEATFRKTV